MIDSLICADHIFGGSGWYYAACQPPGDEAVLEIFVLCKMTGGEQGRPKPFYSGVNCGRDQARKNFISLYFDCKMKHMRAANNGCIAGPQTRR
ncbi:hypothetical protein SAMN05660653_00628 [Desulfonatronum thiosulfatophilum]|uniref:Uncharacterized protein n=1 Tax=Desulfonatronum thiosulfatophilum TaxID=617002 RepID=A0A1G6AWY1_9BACT|nr:hypothetical protein SAMN05660653_00628 [Desulfonatronum thiosulfatophilum]